MKNLLLDLDFLGEQLTKDEMKMVKGGDCGATTNCGSYPCIDSRGYCGNCCVAEQAA